LVQFITAGRAFVVFGRDFAPDPHLWFVLTNPDPTTNHVVAVMLVTARAHTDKTVTLNSVDHPFVQHESNVDYGYARRLLADKIMAAILESRCQLQPDVSNSLLSRLCIGLLQSPRTVNFLKDHCHGLFGHLLSEPGD
jgi:hypothetical protein